MQLPRFLCAAALAATCVSATSAYEFSSVASNDTNARVASDASTGSSSAPFKVSTADAPENASDGGYAVGTTLDVNAADYAISEACKAQSWTITQKKAASMWLQFSSVTLPQGDSLVAVAANGKETAVVPSTDGTVTTTDAVVGSTLTLQYRPSTACSTASPASFTLQRIGLRYTKEWLVTKEAVCGTNTMENVKCFANSNVAEDAKMYQLSKAVMRSQRIREDGKIVVCTAWLWGNKGHIVTNNHCFSSQEMVDASQFDFGVEASGCETKCQPGSCPIARSIKGKSNVKFIASDPNLDISLMQIQGSAATELVSTYGYLRILFGMPTAGEQIYIPQHPGGGARQIAKTDDDNNKSIASIKTVGTSVDVDGTVYTGQQTRSASQQRWQPQSQQQNQRFRKPPRGPVKTTTGDGHDVPQARGELLYGIHSVSQALASGHRNAHVLYVREGATAGAVSGSSAKADLAAVTRIHDMATENDIEIKPITKWMLNHITDDKPHQGVVLDVDPVKLPEFDVAVLDAIAATSTRPVILALDELHDTQNLGAILRSAHFLGCSAVILSERNSAPVSPAASRASAGALEVLVANNKLLRARNLHQALAIGQEKGWRIVGACSGPNSITSNQLASEKPTILVMGNEHKGLRKGIRLCCDEIVTIPGQASDEDSRVDSLNVSVAAAILLYEVLHH